MNHKMEYNSQKEYLEIPEYGRNIQMMVQHAKTIEDSAYRQAFVEKIVMLMHQMHPQNRNIEDYKAKLWKHVFRIANYELDVIPLEGEVPKVEDKFKKPDSIPYPETNARFRHYGHNVQKLIAKALKMEDGPIKDGFVAAIGSYMKLAFRTWNREHFVSDEAIIADLKAYSNGKIIPAENADFNSFTNSLKQNSHKKKKDRDHKGGKKNHKKGGHHRRRK